MPEKEVFVMDASLKASKVTQLLECRWSREKVLALISSVEEFFEDFYDKSMKKKSIWNKVAEHMCEKGYTCSGLSCDKKWRNLKSTYVRVLQKQIQGETSSRFEYFNALHPILGQEIDSSNINDQIVNLEDASDTTEPAEFEDLRYDDGFLWMDEEVHLLLDYIMECQEVFASPGTAIDTVWEDIARQMSHVGEEVNSEQCQRKWLNLKEGLRVNQAKAESSGLVPLWPYFTHTQEVTNTVNVCTTFQREEKIKVKCQTKLKYNKRDDSSLRVAKDEGNQWKTVLARVKHIESSLSVKQRLERLEARVESSRQQQKITQNTNILLLQVLTELRKVNAYFKQEDSRAEIRSVQARPPDSLSCNPTNQEFIIVDAYTDQL